MSEGRDLINAALERTGDIMSMTHDDRYELLVMRFLDAEHSRIGHGGSHRMSRDRTTSRSLHGIRPSWWTGNGR